MATLKTRWFLSILLVNLPNSLALTAPSGPPAPPSPPDCYIPCGDEGCGADINCTWHPRQEPQVPTNYSLHWKPVYTEDGREITGTSLNGLIDRNHFNNHGELCVWIQATNQYGSTKSEEVTFNTADIIKPPTPKVRHEEPLEIEVEFRCESLDSSLQHCDVRSRTEADQAWPEDKVEFHGSYTFENLRPCTDYVYQVRCVCRENLKSDWSDVYRLNATGQAPVGELDVWRDCGTSPASSDCILIWKRLPVSQACGLILGYEVRLSYSEGGADLLNLTTAEPTDQLVCSEMRCHLNASLDEISSVSVSAYNVHGATQPSYLTMPVTGKEQENAQAFALKMTEDDLTVSWDPPSRLLVNLKEYVVQYKQAGRPRGEGFDWIRVNKSRTSAFMTGRFQNFTPYQVSLFRVLHGNDVHHLSSVIAYSLEGTPLAVPLFKVSALAATHVTLFWEPVPLHKRKGVILRYQIGVDGQNVHEVSASPQHRNGTLKLEDLSPGHEYKVWIRAVTAAGPGENVTMKFRTPPHQALTYLAILFGITCPLLMCAVLVFVSITCQGENKSCPLLPQDYCDKVPDPRNSRIFREMKHQNNDPMAWICIPVSEPHPNISLLEVLENQPRACKSSAEKSADTDGLITPAVEEGSSQAEPRQDVSAECHRPDHKYGREAYSKMVDSDEERDRGEVVEEEGEGDSLSSSEEEPCPSGYEKHFMPTALEILEVL